MQDDKIHSIIADPNKKKSQRGIIIALIAVLVLVAGVGVGIYLVQRSQEIRNQAAGGLACEYTVTGECASGETWCQRDLRCYPSDKAASVNCNDTDAFDVVDQRIDAACNDTNNATICGKTQAWTAFDDELRKANYPGPFNHSRVEARAYIGAACPETLAQAANQTSTSPSPTETASAEPTATPTPTATSSSDSQTATPTSTPTPTATSSSGSSATATPTPTATNRVSVVTADQGIPKTGTGGPAIIGAGVGILLLLGAVILAL